MSKIIIEVDSSELHDSLIFFANAASSISAINLDPDFQKNVTNELANALIETLLIQTEESGSRTDDEDPEAPLGYVIVENGNNSLSLWSYSIHKTKEEAEKIISDHGNRWNIPKREDVLVIPLTNGV